VDLEPLLETRDVELVQALIERHYQLTGSERAKHILSNWREMLPRFIKIFPHEFKRVLGVGRTNQHYIPGQPVLVPELAEALHG
jgi:glutamate synthase domain-containing protein 3